MTRNLLFAVLGSLATVGIGFGYSYRNQPAPELPSVWHAFHEVPRDSAEFDRQWHDMGTELWRETIKHPRATLFVACQLKAQGPRAD